MSDFNLGTVTAYGYAKDKGYTGTEDEFAALMASYADVAEQAAESATQAAASATTASTKASEAAASATAAASSKTAAETAQGGAETAASTATTKAGEASASATTASGKATEATTAAGTATTKASEATTAATTATTKAGEASTSATNAAASATRAQEILDSIPADYSQLSDDVEDLKDGLTAVETAFNNSVDVSTLGWELGTLGANGAPASADTRIRSDYINVTEGTVVMLSGNADCLSVHRYDQNKTHLGVESAWTSEMTVPSGVAYIRVIIRKNSWNGTITQEEVATQAQRCSIALAMSRNGLTLAYTNEQIGEAVKQVGTDILNGVTWERGTLDASGNIVSSTSRIVTTNMIDVSSINAILFGIDSGYKYTVTTYDEDGNVITSTGWLYDSNIYVIPSSAKTMRNVMACEPDAWLGDTSISAHISAHDKSDLIGLTGGGENGNVEELNWFNATAVNKLEIPTLDSNTTILALGDSITAAQDETGWVYHFSNMTGCTVNDRAIGGTSYGESATSDSGHWMMTQIGNVPAAMWENADLVIMSCGTNDYGHGTPLAELKSKVQECITAIKAKTNVPIVVITPIRRGTGLNSDPMRKMPIFAGIISNVALANQCNVICGFDIPLPAYTTGYVDSMTQDNLHPNATGANVYARAVINALM